MFSKKFWVISSVVLCLALLGTSVYAADTARKISAYQNSGIKITVDGEKVNLSGLYPIIYNGNTYVSAKALAEAMGGSVKWNGGTQTVEVTTDGGGYGGIPINDNSSGTKTPSPSSRSTDVVTGYSINVTASEVYNDNKSAAAYFFTLYADALETGDTYDLETWIKSQVKYDPVGQWNQGEDHANRQAKYVMNDFKRWDSSQRKEISKKLKQLVQDYDYDESSSYRLQSTSLDRIVQYQVKVPHDGYSSTFTVKFSFTYKDNSSKALLTGIY